MESLTWLKHFLPTILIIALTLGCSKDPADTPDNPGNGDTETDFTDTPPVDNVTTRILGYVTNDRNQEIGPQHFELIQENVFPDPTFPVSMNGLFFTEPLLTDRTLTQTYTSAPGYGYLGTYKTFAVSDALANYTRIKMLTNKEVGIVYNDKGSSFNFENNSSIVFLGDSSIYVKATPGEYGLFSASLQGQLFMNYHNPEQEDFVQRLPCYLAGDEANQRWFLKSYGAISMRMISRVIRSGDMDFYNGASADLKFPIPISMLASAPDSIMGWGMRNGRWTRGGWAKKQGNYYLARIHTITDWNFAVPMKGVYLTVKVRTDSMATLTNTMVRVKLNNYVIAESMTDANGDAICFVPSNTALKVEVLPNEMAHYNLPFSYPVAVEPLKKPGAITVNIPGNTDYLSTLAPTLMNCNSEPIARGMLTVDFDFRLDERKYYVPVIDGKAPSSFWIPTSGASAKIQLTDFATGLKGEVQSINFISGNSHRLNLYTCDNTKLYCNYTIDNKTKYELLDDAASPSVYMIASRVPSNSDPLINMHNTSNRGVRFSAWPLSAGVWIGYMTGDVMINGVSYELDKTRSNNVTYSRFDAEYIQGQFSFHYLDNAKVLHYIEGTFKIKKTF